MAMGIHRYRATGQGIAGAEGAQVAAGLIRRHRVACQREGEAHALRRGGLAGRVEPVIGIRLADSHTVAFG